LSIVLFYWFGANKDSDVLLSKWVSVKRGRHRSIPRMCLTGFYFDHFPQNPGNGVVGEFVRNIADQIDEGVCLQEPGCQNIEGGAEQDLHKQRKPMVVEQDRKQIGQNSHTACQQAAGENIPQLIRPLIGK